MAHPTPLRATHYVSGESIRPGDHVQLAGQPATVEVVLGPNIPPPLPDVDLAWFHHHYGHGFLLRLPDGQTLFKEQSDPDLTFLGRGDA